MDDPVSDARRGAERAGGPIRGEARARAEALGDELAQLRPLAAVGQAARGVAHDFKNVMTVIAGHSELMIRGLDATDPLRAHVEAIRRASVLGTSLARRLLEPAPADVGAGRTADLNDTVGRVARLLQPVLGDGIELATRLHTAAGRVAMEAGDLERVIVNLVLNARDALTGGGRITLATGPGTTPGGRSGQRTAVLAVTDTGPGVDPAVEGRLFDPGVTTSAPGHGRGLGLPTVREIVERSGGRVSVTSAPGRGTTFSIVLVSARVAGPPITC